MQGNYPFLLDPGMLTLAWNSFGHYTFSSVAKLGGVQKREMKKVGGREIMDRKQEPKS